MPALTTTTSPVKESQLRQVQKTRQSLKYRKDAMSFSPWSQCFSRSYASILPTSLGHIAPLTRGYSPRSPDAVIGTARSSRSSFTSPRPVKIEKTLHDCDLWWGFRKDSQGT